MDVLGITPEHNTVQLLEFDKEANDNILKPRPVFTQHDKGIEILVYSLGRKPIRIEKNGSKQMRDYTIIRYESPITKPNGDTIKYLMPKGHATQPFFPPQLLDAFDKKEQIKVLYITEGYFKAFKACMHGIMTVGVPSVTCMRDKETGKLYGDILKLVQTCRVQRLVWLTDGDCRDLTAKDITDGADLYRRPANFYRSVATFADLTSGLEDTTERYFAHINSADIEGHPKGLDDLLIACPASIDAIAKDAHSFDKIRDGAYSGEFFTKMNITYSVGKVHKYFMLGDVNTFYLHYVEKRPEIKGKKFRFNGTLYKYNEEQGKCEIEIPKEAGNYARVGDGYYELIEKPDIHGNIQKVWERRDKTTITDDHTKSILKHIPKYNGFCCTPDHANYQRIIYNCFNRYHPFEHEADEGEFDNTLSLFKHIFGTHKITITNKAGTEQEIEAYQLGLDYFTLLYKKPQQVLPILCLASSENNTGKSTFVKFLKYVFGQNAAIVSNEDLANSFNSHWSGKLLIMCEETKIDKDIVVEKVKALSTGSKIMMNAKGRDQEEIDFFGKFIFCTNNEDNFLPITEKDVRYWVIKVPVLQELVLGMDEILREELPAFLHFINRRKMATENQYRHWFNPEYLRTDALQKVIDNTRPQIIKRWWAKLEELFNEWEGGADEITIPAQEIANMLNRKDDAEYIRRELKKLGYRTEPVARKAFPMIETAADGSSGHLTTKITMKKFNSTYYTFYRKDFAPDTMSKTLLTPAPAAAGGVQEDLPF